VEKPAFEFFLDEESVEYEKAVSVFFKGKALTEGKDYMLSYAKGSAPTGEDTKTVKVTGIGNFTGSITYTCEMTENSSWFEALSQLFV